MSSNETITTFYSSPKLGDVRTYPRNDPTIFLSIGDLAAQNLRKASKMHLYNIFTEIKNSTKIQNFYQDTKPLPRNSKKRGLRATKSVRPCHHEVPESIVQPS
jgi:hypothetical protein